MEPRVDNNPVKSKKRTAKQVLGSIAGMVVPSLTIQKGEKKLTTRKNIIVVLSLYMSHSFSAWGDRMWGFAISLLLATLYPGSLLLPGVHGFLVQLAVAIFGTVIGDWVDNNSRMKVAVTSLILQNGLLSLASVVMALMFYFDWNVCLKLTIFSTLSGTIILLASGANLATVANTIAIEKDWVVVIADGNEDSLAVLNANMRRIDLCCKLLAPALTGVILQHAGPFVTTVIVAVWNIVSFFGEIGLLWIVYKSIPSLSIKKVRGRDLVVQSEDSEEATQDDNKEELLADSSTEDEFFLSENTHKNETVHVKNTGNKYCLKLLNFFCTFKNGWKIYIKQEIALVGFSLASIYLTVLGFSGVTSSYFLTQGLRNDLIGVFQGVGAIFGVIGTILYPFLRKKFGTIRTALFGISTQSLILLFCVASIVVPSNRTSSEATGYYSPDCGNETQSEDMFYTIAPSQMPMPISLENSTDVSNATSGSISVAVSLLLVGVVGCRIGLWTFDLAVQQLIQEKVVEEERGVVGGVMNAMNSLMDMLHYVLVIAAPRPEHFGILTAISVGMVFLGWLLYSIYVRKSRGHFFHFRDFSRYVLRRKRAQVVSTVEEN